MTRLSRLDKIGISLIIAVLVAAWFLFQALPAKAQGPSTEQIQAWLMSPTVLFVLMILGSLVSMLKQWSVAKMDGTSTTLTQYASHWQEIVITLFGNAVAFLGLVETDTLNFASALGIGYVVSSLSDLSPIGSRSTSLTLK